MKLSTLEQWVLTSIMVVALAWGTTAWFSQLLLAQADIVGEQLSVIIE